MEPILDPQPMADLGIGPTVSDLLHSTYAKRNDTCESYTTNGETQESSEKLTELDPPAATISQRAAAIKKAMKEVRECRAKRQVKDALRIRNGPRITDIHALPLLSVKIIIDAYARQLNIVKPDLYAESQIGSNQKDIKHKPEYLDEAVIVARSFVTAGHCWDFHPATRNPTIITRYDGLAITTAPPKNDIHVQSRSEQLAQLSSNDYKLNFENVIKEVNSWDFKVIQIDSVQLSQTLTKFIEVGSIIHKLTPDELTVVANHKGKYANKEEQLVEKVDNSIIPKTIAGLMANGTKFLDAVIYLSMEPSRRPKPSPTDMEPDDEGNIELPTYDDLVKLTTYMFVVFFYILIRAHSPSDTGDYKGQPMPKFITTILGVHDSIGDIIDYLASFDLQKIDPSWVQNVPAKNISQEAINRFGLGVAGYRLVSVFNIEKQQETNTPQHPPSKKQQRKIDKNNEQVQKRLDSIKAQKEKLNKQLEKLDATQDDIDKRLAEGTQGEDISAQDDDSDILSIPSNDELKWPTEDIIKISLQWISSWTD
ncbi:hypothetical protein EPUL_004103 [Erysiphe pulchra]|uniref:Uncharacterized protein n=1 Tax=Erysiphe pulchra TaxID=225359 RepID=A0A2S4PP48_9PEZI|nr:hypothetical protein EPUL_004103 [Erysiphe pulchra]